MKFSSGEKKMLAFCVVVIALPLGAGIFLNGINAAPVTNIPAPLISPQPNGYDFYVAAAQTMIYAKPSVDELDDNDPPADAKTRATRYALARKNAWLKQNNKAFAAFDQAMKTPTWLPPARSFKTQFPFNGQLRRLARAKAIESNALWMRGDYAGALESGLDAVQMGHDVRRGTGLICNLLGVAISSIGRNATSDTIERVDANQAKNAARRLEKMLATRWNLEQVLTEQKWGDQAAILERFGERDWRSNLYGEDWDIEELCQSRIVSKQQIFDDIGADYDRQIGNARLPYSQKGEPPTKINDPFADFLRVPDQRLRIQNARDLVGDRLLMLQLALRAYRLEHGVYPPKLDALAPNYLGAIPADPYGAGELLRYQREGKNYLLWSIGPDVHNDGGTPIPPREISGKTFPRARKFPQKYKSFDGKGDVLAGVNTG